MPLLRGRPADWKGEEYRVAVAIQVPDAAPVPVLVAALGPAMLKLAGRLADGTITWMTGPKTLADHTVPALTAAARDAGRPAPRIVAGLPIALVRDAAAARARAAQDVLDLRPAALLPRDARPRGRRRARPTSRSPATSARSRPGSRRLATRA